MMNLTTQVSVIIFFLKFFKIKLLSQAAPCSITRTVAALHFLFIAERQTEKLQLLIFIIFYLTVSGRYFWTQTKSLLVT